MISGDAQYAPAKKPITKRRLIRKDVEKETFASGYSGDEVNGFHGETANVRGGWKVNFSASPAQKQRV